MIKLLVPVGAVDRSARIHPAALDAYAQPDKSFDDLRQSVRGDQFPNKLRAFTEACKNELRALTELGSRRVHPSMGIAALGVRGCKLQIPPAIGSHE
jgi:hypothetical protein